MDDRDTLALLITFWFGFAAGFYLYLVGFSPNYSIDLSGGTTDTFSVVAEQYGGCEMAGSCALYRIDGIGSYRYSPGGRPGAQQTFLDGELPPVLFQELVTSLENSDLESFSELVEPVSCASYVDGEDVFYTVTIGVAEYELDTCGTNFSHRTPLGDMFVKLWDFFESKNQ